MKIFVLRAASSIDRTVLANRNAPRYFSNVTTTVEAIYESGALKLPGPLPLEENAHVIVTIQSKADFQETEEREARLKKSEVVLTKAWDNPADGVFNELLNDQVGR